MREPSLSCSPVDGAHLGLAAGRRRPPPPFRPRWPLGKAWEPLTEHASPRTGRGEAAALQPWLSGRGSEASAGLGLYSLRRLLDSHGLQRPGFCGLGGTGVCSERRVPDGPALRGAQELGCVRSRERSARGRWGGAAAGGRAPFSRSPSPPPPGPARGSALGQLRSEAWQEVAVASVVPAGRGGEEFPQLTRLAMPGEGSEV